MLCFNYLIKDISSKKKDEEPEIKLVSISTPTPTPSTLPKIEVPVVTPLVQAQEIIETPIVPEPVQPRKEHVDQVTRIESILEAQRKEKTLRKFGAIEEAYNTEK